MTNDASLHDIYLSRIGRRCRYRRHSRVGYMRSKEDESTSALSEINDRVLLMYRHSEPLSRSDKVFMSFHHVWVTERTAHAYTPVDMR